MDLTIARGLDYYTGTVYETTMLDHPEIGSVCSGGRYDNLAEYYTDKKLPGVGISIGLTRLFYVLGEQGMLNPDLPTAAADVLVIPMGEEQQGYAIATATALRKAGIRTQLYAEKKKFKARITYAAKMGIPYVMFLGETERPEQGRAGDRFLRGSCEADSGRYRPGQPRHCHQRELITTDNRREQLWIP